MADAYSEPDDNGSTTIKPVINEMVRTQFCFPDIMLLVDKIIIAKIASKHDSSDVEAYRLYLTDQEKSIQGSRQPWEWTILPLTDPIICQLYSSVAYTSTSHEMVYARVHISF